MKPVCVDSCHTFTHIRYDCFPKTAYNWPDTNNKKLHPSGNFLHDAWGTLKITNEIDIEIILMDRKTSYIKWYYFLGQNFMFIWTRIQGKTVEVFDFRNTTNIKWQTSFRLTVVIEFYTNTKIFDFTCQGFYLQLIAPKNAFHHSADLGACLTAWKNFTVTKGVGKFNAKIVAFTVHGNVWWYVGHVEYQMFLFSSCVTPLQTAE